MRLNRRFGPRNFIQGPVPSTNRRVRQVHHREHVHRVRLDNAIRNRTEQQVNTLKHKFFKVHEAYNPVNKRWSKPVPPVPTTMERDSIGMRQGAGAYGLTTTQRFMGNYYRRARAKESREIGRAHV